MEHNYIQLYACELCDRIYVIMFHMFICNVKKFWRSSLTLWVATPTGEHQ